MHLGGLLQWKDYCLSKKKEIKDFVASAEFIKQFRENFTGLFRVYDRRTNDTIGIYENYLEARSKLWDGSGWEASRNYNELEKIDTEAAKILFGVKD